MGRCLFIIFLLLAFGTGATYACSAGRALDDFSGIFLRVFTGYALIIAVTHLVYLLLPRLGIGSDPRRE